MTRSLVSSGIKKKKRSSYLGALSRSRDRNLLAGLYFIRDKADDEILSLVGGAAQEIPLVLQDRKFACGFEKLDYWDGED